MTMLVTAPTSRLGKLVRQIAATTDENQSRLAKRFGVEQPTVSRWMRGDQEPESKNERRILRVARDLGLIGADWEHDNLSGVPIIGYVGAGGSIAYADGQGPFGEATMPPKGAGPDTVAVVVRGDSMGGLIEDGSHVYYERRHDPPTEALLGKLCVVGLSDDRVLVKRLLRGRSAGLFDLYSANAAPMQDQHVIWAAKVTWIEPS